MITRAALLAVAALAACGPGGAGGGAPATPRTPAGPAVDASWPALDGGTVELGQFRGEVVVIHAFSTWSLAAQLEVEGLDAADARDGVVVVGLALDAEGFALVSPWRKGAGARYLIALADADTRAGAGPLGRIREVPTTFVLDRKGRIAERFDRQLAPAELDAAIARAARD